MVSKSDFMVRHKSYEEMAKYNERVALRRELRRRMKEAQKPFLPKLKHTDLTDYQNPIFVHVVDESSKNISRSASTVKRKGKNKGKNKENSKKPLDKH